MSPERSALLFHVHTRGISRRDLRAFAERLQAEVTGGRPFSFLVADDAAVRELNAKFRHKDSPTDVLSFAPGHANEYLGDIVASLDRVKAQAREFGHSQLDELKILLLHGVLHLIGMDHESDRGGMRRTEMKLRRAFGLPMSLTERARV